MTEEFKNDQIQARILRGPSCHIELDVVAQAALVEKARRNAIKTVNKEVSFPGFRKGKAPEELVLKKFGAQVEKEVHNHLADIAYMEAQKLARVPLLNNNASISFKMKKLTETEASLSFSFETEPSIPNIDASLFEPKEVTRPEVAEKQVEEAIHQMLYYYAQWAPVTDRPIEDGDTILINLDTMEGEVATPVFDKIRFEVSKARMAEWMKKLVAGAKTGDILFGTSQADETAPEADKAEFQPKSVRLTILNVEKPALPELNDEFAQKVGAPDVASMRKSITDMLNGQADEKVKEGLRDQINDFLVEKYSFDLPASLVETEKKHRINQQMQNEKFKASWETMSEDEKKVAESKIVDESSQAVRLFYLSRKIVNDAKISITHQDVQDEAVATMRAFNTRNMDKIPKEIYALALSKIILSKAQDYLLNEQKKAFSAK
jgi:trigger factor